MPTLTEQITTAPRRNDVVSDLSRFLDAEVSAKGGLSGLAIKAAYATVKAIKPTFVPEVIDGLLDSWAARLDPIYAETLAAGGSVSQGFVARSSAVADALLSVTDDRATKTTHGTARKAYEKLRPTAKKHVEEAIPRLAPLLEKHAAAG